MRLALIRQRYAQDGGAERFVARAMEALRGENFALTLVTREWTQGQGFDVLTCDPFYFGRTWRDWSFARSVCRTLESAHFDLVQSHERIACCDLYRAGDGVHREWLAQLARVRGPLGRLGLALNPYHRYTLRAERRLFTSQQLKAVICNSSMVKEEIRRHFGVPAERLHVIYSGIDARAFHPDLKRHRAAVRAQYGIPGDATLFLFVGSGFERKGVAALLQALKRLPADRHVLIVGHDKHADSYARRSAEPGLAGRAHFAGRQADVGPYYGAADALVLPTLYDPFPNVALEAMASGLPIITSTKCGAAELIEPGNNGFVCDALDDATLAEQMRVLSDPAAASRMGAAARQLGESLSLERMKQRLVALYRDLLGNARIGRSAPA
jgi:UDP-glucose:(heptosyl)LPS alpha-1,3-glucosyltransferase